MRGRVVPRLRRHTHATFPRAGEHLVPQTRPGPPDHGRTVPTSRHSALAVVPEKSQNSTHHIHFWTAGVDSNEAERKRGTKGFSEHCIAIASNEMVVEGSRGSGSSFCRPRLTNMASRKKKGGEANNVLKNEKNSGAKTYLAKPGQHLQGKFGAISRPPRASSNTGRKRKAPRTDAFNTGEDRWLAPLRCCRGDPTTAHSQVLAGHGTARYDPPLAPQGFGNAVVHSVRRWPKLHASDDDGERVQPDRGVLHLSRGPPGGPRLGNVQRQLLQHL